MKTVNRLLAAAALVGALPVVASAAAQTTYSNVAGGVAIYDGPFGASRRTDVPIFGQVFTAPSGNLLSWTFYNDASTNVGENFAVAAWNGTTVTGADLFGAASNAVLADPGNPGFYSHTISGINLALTAGQSYYAYFTTYNVAQPVHGVIFEGASTSPLGGAATFSSYTGAPAGAAYAHFNDSLVYSATFSAVAAGVPETATWALMIVGFGAVGLRLRRRSRPAVRVAYA